ncbi:LDH2 family malate/lactate/ureidoglycolate dehydrogenase [Stella humosa]|uniref:LDH2 family malate/lactate/ureidoglycolate dehydrogenase n=1 Tax=Stella humosa TaxID=94 RepID=A0A3N1KZ02_9PROT|nr:Ldh family oxidoreductase [Stella humosa]ROP83870.1 LDH2 family malate/lactate/ureidoglycolate dehydrogenase [Stella humosa]BBK32868.1 malate dehydrogenase [Stella humosa]
MDTISPLPLVPADRLHRQIETILVAWGMDQAIAAATAGVMVDTDLRGIDSHGVTMLLGYEERLHAGRLNMQAVPRVVRESPVTALMDAGGGLGHYPSLSAMDLAIDKARRMGVALVAVRNSNHYGAAGAYALRAAEAGLIGITGTGSRTRCVVPTGARDAMFATNPIAFAAPTRRNRPFVLDMATSTVAVGKVNICWLNDRPVPAGWVVDEQGRAVTDAEAARRYCLRLVEGGVTPLGGLPAMSSHKGYGLAAMIEILSTQLSGAIYCGTAADDPRAKATPYDDLGHFFLAVDPRAFRPDGAFEDELDEMMDLLRAAPPVDPAKPVLVAGDPEWANFDRRRVDGIPMPVKLVEHVQAIAERAGVAFVLG